MGEEIGEMRFEKLDFAVQMAAFQHTLSFKIRN